ncbi:MAG: ionic transporter y4hA [Ferruginibacter sp.]
MKLKPSILSWSVLAPIIAWILFFLNTGSVAFSILLALALIIVVLSSVHHAELVAHRAGEPYGTLVLAIAITVIEVSLIVSLMIAGGESATALARDTVFAAVMILLTGIIGLCLLAGGYRYKEQVFGRHGVNAALVTLTAICVLTLVLPNYTSSIAGPFYSKSQLIFISIVCLVLYGSFVLVQTVRHRDYFLPTGATEEFHAKPPSKKETITSLVFLLISLGAVVLIAKKLSPAIEKLVQEAGAPQSLVGVIVAMVILLPEGIAAFKAARKNRLQTSINLALGSALASIGLTIPAVGIVSLYTGMTITLGIDTKSILLLGLALFTVTLSFGTGRTTILQGVVLLLLFAVYLFTTIVP